MLISNETITIAVDWFKTYACTEKREVETLFSQLTKDEKVNIKTKLSTIFNLDEDKWSMIDILEGVDVLFNTIAICLRSIKNAHNNNIDNNNIDQIITKIPYDCVKYAFLITKRHLILYGQIENQKDQSFFRNSTYKSVYGFCKIFSIDNKLSVLLMNKLNVENLSNWLNFDDNTNTKIIKHLSEDYGVRDFQDICQLLTSNMDFIKLIKEDESTDKRLEFKLVQLSKIITRFMRKWDLDF